MKPIAFSPPDIQEQDIQAVVDALRSSWITTGPVTKAFEKAIAAYCGTSCSVCLNSATAAMELTLHLLGIGKGDEVITTVYTYTASASVIAHVGATPVLVDVAQGSYQMDVKAVERAITDKTKAIIAVDIAGVVYDYDLLFKIIEEKKALFKPASKLQEQIGRIVVIADAAHSFGAVYKEKKSGNIADFTCFSFHAVKNLTTAEGGAVTWRSGEGFDDQAIYKQFMLFALHGQSKDALEKMKLGSWEYDIALLGYKCNMTDIVAGLGLSQLKRYNTILQKRKEIIGYYNELLGSREDINFLIHKEQDRCSSFHLCMTQILRYGEKERNEFIQRMAERGIATNVHYKPLPMHTAYKKLGFCIENYPNAYKMYSNEVTLPLHTLLSKEDIEYIAMIIEDILK